VFFARRWGRPVTRQIGPLHAVETSEGLLLDQLVLIAADGTRWRFGLLAGQLKNARDDSFRGLLWNPGVDASLSKKGVP